MLFKSLVVKKKKVLPALTSNQKSCRLLRYKYIPLLFFFRLFSLSFRLLFSPSVSLITLSRDVPNKSVAVSLSKTRREWLVDRQSSLQVTDPVMTDAVFLPHNFNGNTKSLFPLSFSSSRHEPRDAGSTPAAKTLPSHTSVTGHHTMINFFFFSLSLSRKKKGEKRRNRKTQSSGRWLSHLEPKPITP